MKKRLMILLCLGAIGLAVVKFFEGTDPPSEDERDSSAITLNQLAYDINKDKGDYTVYLDENGTLTPYYVLDADYCGGGGVLLLRWNILSDLIPFNANGSSYYAGSDVDRYLCEEYLMRFPEELQNRILETQISISKDFPDTHETEVISRKAFLLSCTETQIATDLAAVEGVPLLYFKAARSRIASNGAHNASWGLRSTYTAEQGLVWGISPDGTTGGGAVQSANGVRPSICLPPDSPIAVNVLDTGSQQYVLQPAKEEVTNQK